MELYFNDKKYKLDRILYESFINEEDLISEINSKAKENIENILGDNEKIKSLLSIINGLKQNNDKDNQNIQQDTTNTIKNLETLQNTISQFSLN